jgi:hypothetical protein
MATPFGAGAVDVGLFLPAERWVGPDLDHGAALGFGGPFDPEGSVAVHECDPDKSWPTGRVGILPVGDFGANRPVGAQKIRVLGSPQEASAAFDEAASALRGCTPFAGANYTVNVSFDPDGAIGTQPPAERRLLLARIETTMLDTHEVLISWVALADLGNGTALSTLVIREPPATTGGWPTLRRIGQAAAEVLRAAPTP